MEQETQTLDSTLNSVDWERWRTPLLAIGALALGFAVLFAWWKFRQSYRETEANRALAAAVTVDAQLKVAQSYMGTDQVALALLSIAAQQNDRSDRKGALETYSLFLTQYPRHELKNAALLGRAATLEHMGNMDDAVEAYRAAAQSKPADIYNAVAMLGWARVLEHKGDRAQAKQILNDCALQYGETTYGQSAKNKLAQIKP
jgi:tetratricopeptide (TPR) repeat protein